jgi:hypothetical protein
MAGFFENTCYCVLGIEIFGQSNPILTTFFGSSEDGGRWAR